MKVKFNSLSNKVEITDLNENHIVFTLDFLDTLARRASQEETGIVELEMSERDAIV